MAPGENEFVTSALDHQQTLMEEIVAPDPIVTLDQTSGRLKITSCSKLCFSF